jgi:hypothetical protein
MSPRPKSKSVGPKRRIVRSKDIHIHVRGVLRGVPRAEPDYKKLARALILTAKDMQRARQTSVRSLAPRLTPAPCPHHYAGRNECSPHCIG